MPILKAETVSTEQKCKEKATFFFGTTYQIIVGHVVGYVKKTILTLSWVCKWRKGVRKHLQTCLASDTIRHGHSHYFIQWICAQKTHDSRVFCSLKKRIAKLPELKITSQQSCSVWERYAKQYQCCFAAELIKGESWIPSKKQGWNREEDKVDGMPDPSQVGFWNPSLARHRTGAIATPSQKAPEGSGRV